jgi:hypothetical protein
VKLSRILAAFLVLFVLAPRRSVPQSPVAFTAHEWGTFTSIAGPNGTAMEWLPLAATSGLPNFVEHLDNANFKGGLRGTVRMETPVLYFYSPQVTTVSVHVAFSHGLITEWYPHAEVPAIRPSRLFDVAQKNRDGAISWPSVQIDSTTSGDFPIEATSNPYYAARQTSSASLAVVTSSDTQHEKFLFYRGVSMALPPLTAAVVSDFGVLSQNHLTTPISNAILFERRGSRVGFRAFGPLHDQATVAPPALDGSLESLFSDLEGMLIAEGLFSDEAHAMLETWKSSWFEEGSRILYIVPRSFVDSVLPLTITPAPAQLTRVFIGRVELITPATQQAVVSAFAADDHATLAKYGRFLEPILHTMLDAAPDQSTRDQLAAYLDSVYRDFYSQPREQPAVSPTF